MRLPNFTEEHIATSGASHFRPYSSKFTDSAQVITWVQIDLESSTPIDFIRLYPYSKPHRTPGEGFPLRFRIECAEDRGFHDSQLIFEASQTDYPDPKDRVLEFPAHATSGRYVRLTATLLRSAGAHLFVMEFPQQMRKACLAAIEGKYVFELSKIEVFSQGSDSALHRPVTVDVVHGNPNDAQQLTRSLRPQGEGMVTDNPHNVTCASEWRPVSFRAQAPRAGVRLGNGLFLPAMEHNVRYLLESFTTDDLLYDFRKRAGKSVSAPSYTRTFWDTILPGSSAGRFLMGAGNILRWIDHDRLRSRMDALIEGIAECREPDGYLMAYPKDTFFHSEHGAYTRAWVTHGLIEAGYAGAANAFGLLRGYYDWYNKQDFLPLALRGCNFGPQGTVANTRLYFTPVGQPADLHLVQRYFQENYWLDDLTARNVDAVWQYPYDRPHCYLLTFIEPYVDLYRATGERRYLDAALGGWDLFRENWQAIGGSIMAQEGEETPPRANPLFEERRGENCGSAFWMLLNQRLHQLEPEQERYVAEIEKSIYNVLLANQAGSEGIRYFTRLVGRKDKPTRINTCCEGQGARILGALPEYIYSLADDGVYVNLFEPSTVCWTHAGGNFQLQMQTNFPQDPNVCLIVAASSPVAAKIRIRTPSWAEGVMEIAVNGQPSATGTPGTYVTLDRQWAQGDTISFVLPVAFKLTPYRGVDRVEGRERFALEYGPILMAALDRVESAVVLEGGATLEELATRLQPMSDRPLHFTMPADTTGTVWIPYFQINAENFSCVPHFERRP